MPFQIDDWILSLVPPTLPDKAENVKTRSEIPLRPSTSHPPVSAVRQISGEVPNIVFKVSPKSPSPATCLPLLIKPAEYSCGSQSGCNFNLLHLSSFHEARFVGYGVGK